MESPPWGTPVVGCLCKSRTPSCNDLAPSLRLSSIISPRIPLPKINAVSEATTEPSLLAAYASGVDLKTSPNDGKSAPAFIALLYLYCSFRFHCKSDMQMSHLVHFIELGDFEIPKNSIALPQL